MPGSEPREYRRLGAGNFGPRTPDDLALARFREIRVAQDLLARPRIWINERPELPQAFCEMWGEIARYHEAAIFCRPLSPQDCRKWTQPSWGRTVPSPHWEMYDEAQTFTAEQMARVYSYTVDPATYWASIALAPNSHSFAAAV